MKETGKAKDAALAYFELGPKRSLRQLLEVLGRKPTYMRQLERWSAAHAWRERAEQYDRELLERSIAGRSADVERARQAFFDVADEASRVAIEIMRKTDARDRDRLSAAEAVLDRVGVSKGRRLEIDLPRGSHVELQIRAAVTTLSREQLEALDAILARPIEVEAETDDEASDP